MQSKAVMSIRCGAIGLSNMQMLTLPNAGQGVKPQELCQCWREQTGEVTLGTDFVCLYISFSECLELLKKLPPILLEFLK